MNQFIKILFISTMVQIIIVWCGFAMYGFDLNGLQNALRLSGKFSLLIFTLLFLQVALSPSKVFGLETRHWLITFASVHFIHLICILFFITSSRFNLVPTRLLGGAFAYLLIFVLPYLYFTGRTVKNSVLYFYLYYVSFVIFMTYLPRVQGKMPEASGNMTEYVFGISYIILLVFVGTVLILMKGMKQQKAVV
jgi:hypothetical protein